MPSEACDLACRFEICGCTTDEFSCGVSQGNVKRNVQLQEVGCLLSLVSHVKGKAREMWMELEWLLFVVQKNKQDKMPDDNWACHSQHWTKLPDLVFWLNLHVPIVATLKGPGQRSWLPTQIKDEKDRRRVFRLFFYFNLYYNNNGMFVPEFDTHCNVRLKLQDKICLVTKSLSIWQACRQP